MRHFLIAGNWKMHTTASEAASLARDVAERCLHIASTTVHVLLCPPYTSLHAASEAVRLTGVQERVTIGAQNCHHEAQGAFTGEVSASMLTALGCTHVILGHSERRQYAGETDEMLNTKLKAALRAGLIPIYCVGETLEERQRGVTFDVLRRQMGTALAGIELQRHSELVIAYEPVWAIGTGLAATSEQAQEAHAFLRSLLAEQYGNTIASNIALLYGGSMKPDNALDLLSKPDVNGGLIGGASLQAESFAAIIAAAAQASAV
jgi:triosephosphate isomerase